MSYKEDIICKAIKDVLIASMKEEVNTVFSRNYCNIPTKEWIGLIRTLEAMDDKRCADRGYHNTITKKKMDDKSHGDDSNSESFRRFPHKKHKPNTLKCKQHKERHPLKYPVLLFTLNEGSMPQLQVQVLLM